VPVTLQLSRTAVVRIERAAARAWPARRTEDVDGWLWRCSGGGFRRANSVLPLKFRGRDPERAIDRVEVLYREAGARSCFQVVSVGEPQDLDARLAARGYTFEEPCLLLARRLEASPMPAGVRVTSQPSDEWLAIYTEPHSPERRRDAPRVLAGAPGPKAFFLAQADGRAAATALAIVSPDGIAIVECVATRSDRRRQGAASLAMDALESWAAGAGASLAALQVVAANASARALYEGRGYGVVGHYHYRWRDAD
jgi:GNAT superfamily N-acetyltransferase